MSEINNVFVIGVTVCIIGIALKGIKSDFGLICSLVGATIVLTAAIDQFGKLHDFMSGLRQKAEMPTEYTDIMFKILGICLMGEFSVSMCRDHNHSTLGDALEMFCKCSVMVLALPIFEDALNMIGELLG